MAIIIVVWVGFDRCGGEVAVEELVQVLVAADALHHLVADRVAEQCAGVAVRDAGGQLLQCEVDEPLVQRRVGGLAARHLRHARALELDRVDRPRRHQVAVDRHRVAALLGGPTAHPGAPGAVLAEHPLDGAEVVRQVVLGEQVDQQRAAHLGADLVAGEVGVVGAPLVAGLVVAAAAYGT